MSGRGGNSRCECSDICLDDGFFILIQTETWKKIGMQTVDKKITIENKLIITLVCCMNFLPSVNKIIRAMMVERRILRIHNTIIKLVS